MALKESLKGRQKIVTKIYTAGEHARVIKSDLAYKGELGDQTGLVGTVVRGTGRGNVDLTFPHTGDAHFYYLSNEIEPVGTTPAPEPEKEYLFREGDHVRFLAGHNEDWTGAEFTVLEDVEDTGSSYSLVRVKVTKTSGTAFMESWYNVGATAQIGASKLEKFTPAPEPKFKIGDWVKVEGYAAPTWDGTVGKVVESYGKSVLIKNEEHNEFGLTFPVASLVPAEEPVKPPKFKAGDWAKVGAGYGNYSGKVFEVKAGEAESKNGNVELHLIDPAGRMADWTGYFATSILEQAKKPVPTFNVGDRVEFIDDYNGTRSIGDAGTVTSLSNSYNNQTVGKLVYLTMDNGDTINGVFACRLKLTDKPKPWAPKFKVGDYVRTSGWGHTWDDVTSIVVAVPQTVREFYTIALTAPSGGLKKDHEGRFTERKLIGAQKPAEPHWTESKPVGTVAQVTYGDNGDVNRVILKTAEDEWLHLYQDVRGVVYTAAKRNNKATKVLAKNVAWAVIE
jgi:hypothetical protein